MTAERDYFHLNFHLQKMEVTLKVLQFMLSYLGILRVTTNLYHYFLIFQMYYIPICNEYGLAVLHLLENFKHSRIN